MQVLMVITTLFLSPMNEAPIERYRSLVLADVCYPTQQSAMNYRFQEVSNFNSYTIVQCIKVQSL